MVSPNAAIAASGDAAWPRRARLCEAAVCLLATAAVGAVVCLASSSPSSHGDDDAQETWHLLHSAEIAEGNFSLRHFVSNRTGLKFTFLKTPLSRVRAQICLNTWSTEDAGLPHITEHMIFQGSKKRPYYWLLMDIWPKFWVSTGSLNGYTSYHRTVFYFKAANGVGTFHVMLGSLAEAVFFPKLRRSDFALEVHHLNGKGRDAGTVLAETTGIERRHNTCLRDSVFTALFGNGSTFARDTAGFPESLRTRTTYQMMLDFHRQFYRPSNAQILMSGNLTEEQALQAVDLVDGELASGGFDLGDAGPTRPSETPLELKEDVWTEIRLPDGVGSSSSQGELVLAWATATTMAEDYGRIRALRHISRYLGTAGGPRDLNVIIEGVFAERFSVNVIDYDHPVVMVTVRGLLMHPTLVASTIQAYLDNLEEHFDLDDMRVSLDKECLRLRRAREEEAWHGDLFENAMRHQLYFGDNEDEDGSSWEDVVVGEEAGWFQKQPRQFWLDLAKETFGRPKVVVHGKPDWNMSISLSQTEHEREKQQIQTLGDDLEQLAEEVEDRRRLQQSIPAEEWDKISTGKPKLTSPTDSIACNHTRPEERCSNFNATKLTSKVGLGNFRRDHSFFHFVLEFDAKRLLPATPSGGSASKLSRVLLAEEVASCWESFARATLDGYERLKLGNGVLSAAVRFNSWSGTLEVTGSAQAGKYQQAVEFLGSFLLNSTFSSVAFERHLRWSLFDLRGSLSKGKQLMETINQEIRLNNSWVLTRTANQLVRWRLLTKALDNIRGGEGTKEPAEFFSKIQDVLTSAPSKIRLLAAPVSSLGAKAEQPWISVFPKAEKKEETKQDPPTRPSRHVMAVMPRDASCHLLQSAPVDREAAKIPPPPPDGSGIAPLDANLDALLWGAAQAALTATLVKELRGRGLAYTASFADRAGGKPGYPHNHLAFGVSRSTHLVSCYRVFQTWVDKLTNGTDQDRLSSGAVRFAYRLVLNEHSLWLSSTGKEEDAKKLVDLGQDRKQTEAFAFAVNGVARNMLKVFTSEPVFTSAVCGSRPLAEQTAARFEAELGLRFELVNDLDNSQFAGV